MSKKAAEPTYKKVCAVCGQDASGPDAKSVDEAMERHAKKAHKK